MGDNKTNLLTSEEKELLNRAASLMEELLETLEVAQDKKLARDLEAALREVEQGKTMSLDELVAKLNRCETNYSSRNYDNRG